MALIQVNYLSKALFRTVPVNVVLPVDKVTFDTMDYAMRPGQRFKTLYLLHGLLGNYTDWVSGTRIQRWAEDRDLAVVMPSGDNAFYVDGIRANDDYGTFVGEELPRVMRSMFPLSDAREDTFIAGLSMGGFGAIRNGMKYAGTFSRVAGLSAAVSLFEPGFRSLAGEETCFGDYEEASRSDKSHLVVLEQLRKKVAAGEAEWPEFYLACGTEDSLYPFDRGLAGKLADAGARVTWDEGAGGHDWDFWDSQIRKVLDWLPLGEAQGALGSGNVGLDD